MALVPSRRSFAPFVIASTAMLESEIYHYPRLTAQNVVFLAAVAALCALYVRRVEAPAAQKAFVIAVVMCYGYLASLVQFIISELLPLPNERLYETLRISMSMVTVVLIWWALRTVKIVSEGSRRRPLLLDTLERERARRTELQSDLAAANRRVEELEERAAGASPSSARPSPAFTARGAPPNPDISVHWQGS